MSVVDIDELDVLVRARALVEQGWCQNADRKTSARGFGDKHVCYCMGGAIKETISGHTIATTPQERHDCFIRIADVVFPGRASPATVTDFNDGHAKEDVLAKLDGAIARVRAARAMGDGG
jgi:hypothetical protein